MSEETSDAPASDQCNTLGVAPLDISIASPVISSASVSPHSSPNPPVAPPPPFQEPWYPFLSKPHMLLCLLYHGSHR